MNDRLPLTEVSGDEALARVTYQIIIADYHNHPDLYDDPTSRLLALTTDWQQSGFKLIADDLRLAAIWVGNGGTVATWLRARIVFHAGRTTRLISHARRPNR